MAQLSAEKPDPATQGSPSSLRRSVGSLQFKATTLVVVVTLTITWLACAYLLRGSMLILRHHQEEHLVAVTSLLARASQPLVERTDGPGLERLAEYGLRRAALAYVGFVDQHGRVLAEAVDRSVWPGPIRRDGPPSGVMGEPVAHPAHEAYPAVIEIARPIGIAESSQDWTDELQHAGAYVIAAIPAQRWWPMLSQKLDTLIGVGLLGAVAAIPLGFLVVRRIIAPMERLGEAMRRFSLGELNVRSGVQRGDEIGALANSFDRMADQHEQTMRHLVALNEELEHRVEERTEQLRELASRDSLTGLYNRRHLNELLDRSFREALRYEHDLSCIMLDLDGFKEVNDLHGHLVGDEVLILLADVIREQMRASDIPARFGGDEFVILLPQTDAKSARVLGERIVRRFEQALGERDDHVVAGVSVGVASLHGRRLEKAEDLVRAADSKLYDAKARLKHTA
ncbi:MAG: diguanylate cyclase [Phycisphaerae bacterium]|nr:diguanylate cyclase [Phycisphaerae bacterium]